MIRYADAMRRLRFEWGKTDCVILSFGALDVMHGTSLAAQWSGVWTSRREALAAAKAHEWVEVVEAAGVRLSPRNVTVAQRGDLIQLPSDSYPRLVVELSGFVLAATPRLGVQLVPSQSLRDAAGALAWRSE